MADENMLRYNGMLIGVFELLADARDQVSSVTNAINAQQQFWLADAALAASVIGKPTPTGAAWCWTARHWQWGSGETRSSWPDPSSRCGSNWT